jgi:hypothetical protein
MKMLRTKANDNILTISVRNPFSRFFISPPLCGENNRKQTKLTSGRSVSCCTLTKDGLQFPPSLLTLRFCFQYQQRGQCRVRQFFLRSPLFAPRGDDTYHPKLITSAKMLGSGLSQNSSLKRVGADRCLPSAI